MNFLDRFFGKLFLGFVLLLGVVLLDHFNIINYDNLKNKLSDNFNFLQAIKVINGKVNIIPIEFDEAITVSKTIYSQTIKGENERQIILDDYEGVENYNYGIVVNIRKEKDKSYTIYVKGIDDVLYVYKKLTSINCSIYHYVKPGDVLGSASSENEKNYFIFSTFLNNKYYDILEFNES